MEPVLAHVNWNVTYACTFNCAHCYSRALADLAEATPEQKRAIADNIIRAKVVSVNLGGGEPLLCPDLLPLVERLAAHDIDVSLCTNGWRATAQEAGELRRAGLAEVFLSLDDARPAVHDAFRGQPGSFDEVLRAARLYREAGMATRLSVTVTRQNFEQLGALVALAGELGCGLIELKRLKLRGNAADRADLALTPEQERALFAAVPEWKRTAPVRVVLVYGFDYVEGLDEGCPCGKSALAVQANGDVSPCVYNPVPLGNALQDDLFRLWRESPALRRLRAGGSCMALEHLEGLA